MNLNSGPKEGITTLGPLGSPGQNLPDSVSPGCCSISKPNNTLCLGCSGLRTAGPPSHPSLLHPKPPQVPFVFSKTVVCLMKATSPAFSERHLSHRRAGQTSGEQSRRKARPEDPLPHSSHQVPEGPAVAVVSLLAAAHTLVVALLISHAQCTQRGRVVPRVVHRHTTAIEELTHRWGRMKGCDEGCSRKTAREEKGSPSPIPLDST